MVPAVSLHCTAGTRFWAIPRNLSQGQPMQLEEVPAASPSKSFAPTARLLRKARQGKARPAHSLLGRGRSWRTDRSLSRRRTRAGTIDRSARPLCCPQRERFGMCSTGVQVQRRNRVPGRARRAWCDRSRQSRQHVLHELGFAVPQQLTGLQRVLYVQGV